MNPPAAVDRAARLPGLDLVRAVAIAWVMAYHASLYGLLPGDAWVVRFGWMGVDLFFVLSGFLIGGQLLRPFAQGRQPDYLRFAGRRLLRTLPAYFVVLALYAAIPGVRDRAAMDPLWRFATFTQNLLTDPSAPKALSHAWSLCVEEQFYLVFPILVALLALRPSATKVVAMIAAVLVGGMALRGWLWLDGVATSPFHLAAEPDAHAYMRLIYYPSWSRLDGLTLGVAAACLQVFRPAAWSRLTRRPTLLLAGGVAGVVASTILFQDQIAAFWPTVFGFPLLSLSMVAIVAGAGSAQSFVGRRSLPGVQASATGAYSLYLTHKAVFHAVQRVFEPSSAWASALAFGLALLAGALLYALIERPFLRLRDRLDGRSRTSLAERRQAPANPIEARG